MMRNYGDGMSLVSDVVSECVLSSGWIQQIPGGSFSTFRRKYTM